MKFWEALGEALGTLFDAFGGTYWEVVERFWEENNLMIVRLATEQNLKRQFI